MARRTLSRDDITDDTPIMLAVAAEIAFPDGTVSASSLRRERDKGRLVVSRIAGKDYTTLKAIRDMMEMARFQRSPERIAEDEAIERGFAAVRAARRAAREQSVSADVSRAHLRRLTNTSRAPKNPLG